MNEENPILEIENPNLDPEQELYGSHVKKIGGCAVIAINDESVALPLPITYPQLVSALIKRKYDTDKTEAITANYISAISNSVSETKAAEYTSEYQAYQAWRNQAKAIAKEVMGINA